MARRIIYYLFVIAALTYALLTLMRYEPAPRGVIDTGAFMARALQTANQIRGETQLEQLRSSEQLLETLRDYVERDRLAAGQLEDVFAHVERSLPQAHEIAVNLVYSRSEETLQEELSGWADVGYAQHTHYATWVFRDEKRRALGCLAVLARELPKLELPISADRTAPTYFDTCRLCGAGHGISLGRQAQNTLIMTCPHCDRPYNLIATDSSGNWRRANQFFDGVTSPDLDPGLTRLEELMAIWQIVASKCQYKTDAQRIFGSDSWELPVETYHNGHGDCEDTSLLLVDMLIAHGFEARVALGEHEGEGHAWCVVRLDDQAYLLESTWADIEGLSAPPSVDEIALDYRPKYLFDHDALYFLRQTDWTGDYWAEQRWQKVEYPEPIAENAAEDSGVDAVLGLSE